MRPLLCLLLSLGLASCTCENAVDDDDGDNRDPTLNIASPLADAVLSEAGDVQLTVQVSDLDGLEGLIFRWDSDLSGEVVSATPVDGNVNTVLWAHPEPGDHALTVTVQDPDGGEASASVSIKVLPNTPPTCSIGLPTPGQALTLPSTGLLIAEGTATDDETPDQLTAQWESEAGDVLGEGTPDEDGFFTDEVQGVSGAMTLVLRVADNLGLECVERVSFTTNFRPTSPEVSLAPDPPYFDDDLVGTKTADGVDPDSAQPVTYRWAWQRDGDWVDGADGDTIPAGELRRGEEWTVFLYAVDIQGAESEPATASVIVGNTPPSAPVVVMDPNPAPQALDLQCLVLNPGDDPDVDDVITYEYAWSRVGDGNKPWDIGWTSWAETEVGDTWECSARATDGELTSEWSSVVTGTVEEGCTAGTFGGAGVVTVPDAPDLRLGSGSFTVEAWVKLLSFGTGGTPSVIVQKAGSTSADGWVLGVCGNQMGCVGSPVFRLSGPGDPAITGNDNMSLNQWHHVALAYDQNTSWGYLYLDGIEVGNNWLPQPNGATNAPLTIGDDTAGVPGSNHIGVIDDVRISDNYRYLNAGFVPDRTLYPDNTTIALWGFEEGESSDVHDLSLNGHEGVAAGMAWTTDSSCYIDRAPNQPVLEITPNEPPVNVDLTCSVDVPAVDPEGNAVTYPGYWTKNGAVWSTFNDLPSTVPASAVTGTDEWRCYAEGFDGAVSSEIAVVTAWSGFLTICTMTVSDATSPLTQGCSFFVPVDGQLRMTLSNPDGSSDGGFFLDTGIGAGLSLYSGTQDAAVSGTTVIAYTSNDAEINVGGGPHPIQLSYDPGPGIDNTGTSTLTLDYVPGDWIEPNGAFFIGNATVNGSNAAPQLLGPATIPPGGRLLFQTQQCGTGGGVQGIYADQDGLPGNDVITSVPTGDVNQCTSANGISTQSIDPGTYTFSVVLEDDNFINNGGTRSVDVYWYEP